MKRNSLPLAILAILFAALAVVAQNTPPEIVEDKSAFLGSITEGVYKNTFFGFSLNIPTDVFVLDEGEVAVGKEAGVKMLAKDVAKNTAAWEKAALAEVILLGMTVRQPGSARNSTLAFGAVRQPKGVSSRMVANVSKEHLLKNPNIKLVEDTKQVVINNQEFSYLRLSFDIDGIRAYFDYHVAIRNGHAMSAVITSVNDEDAKKLRQVLGTINFYGK